MAIFVEGQTEQLFVERLIKEIATGNSITFATRKLTGRPRSVPNWINIWTSANASGHRFFILIIDCAGYTTVKSDIRDNYDSLVNAGYSVILGIRDAYPEVSYSDIGKLRSGLTYGMRTAPIRVGFILGVMEIETWFICEHTHFERVDANLTVMRIKAAMGFDPTLDDIQLRANPCSDLDAIYRLAGKRYQKDHRSTKELLDRLDFTFVYCDVRNRLPDLDRLIESISGFLSS